MSITDIALLGLSLAVFLLAFPILFFGAPFVPSFQKESGIDFESLFDTLRERGVKRIIDLGSGDGRVVIEFAQHGFTATGIELNPLLVLWSRRKVRQAGLQGEARIKWGNFWNTDLKEYDAVFMFQFATANKLLAKKLKEELNKGSVVISAGFELPGSILVKKVSPFFLYEI